MTDILMHRKDVAGRSGIKESHLGKCSNEKLCTSTMVNDGTLRIRQLPILKQH